MTYEITSYSKQKAKNLGVTIKPSTVKGKKIDVFKNGEKVASIGDIKYKDFPTYRKTEGEAEANKRRKMYKQRHESDRKKRGTPGYYADQILW